MHTHEKHHVGGEEPGSEHESEQETETETEQEQRWRGACARARVCVYGFLGRGESPSVVLTQGIAGSMLVAPC